MTRLEPRWSKARAIEVAAGVRRGARRRRAASSARFRADAAGGSRSATHRATVTARPARYQTALGGTWRGSGGGSPDGRRRLLAGAAPGAGAAPAGGFAGTVDIQQADRRRTGQETRWGPGYGGWGSRRRSSPSSPSAGR